MKSIPNNVIVRSAIRRIGNSPAGQRAAWLALVLLVGLFAAGSYLHWLPAGLTGPIGAMATPAALIPKELLQVFVVLTATMVVGFIKRNSMAAYGLPGRDILGRDFWEGAGWGFAMLSATIGLMAVTHSYTLGSVALSRPKILECGMLWAAAFLLVGLAEELAFRGYLQYALTTRMGFWLASIITSLFFGFAHRNNSGENWIGLANIVLIGMFACLALRRTGSLWFPIGWHMAFDWGETFFYSVPNSGTVLAGHLFNASLNGSKWLTGGTVGPEASVFNVFTTLIGMALLAVVYRKARYPRPAQATGAQLSPAT